MSSDSLHANGNLGAAPRLTWLRAAGVGICWGVSVSALESLKLPLGHLDPGQFAGFMAGIAPFWIIAGVALATGTAWLEHKRRHGLARLSRLPWRPLDPLRHLHDQECKW